MGKKAKKIDEKRKINSQATEPAQKDIQTQKPTIWQRLIPPTILGMVTTAFYYRSLTYPFQFDDLANITKKFDIRFANPLSQWWHSRRWMGEWLNRLNFEWGRFEPYFYRVTSFAIHLATGILIFFVILEGCAHLKKRPFFAKNALAIATATAALFLLHPVQTQAVSYVIQARLEGLATLFIMATLLLFLKAFHFKNLIARFSLIALALFVGFVSCGTKEIAIVAPLLAIIMDWFFLAEEDWASFKSRLWFHGLFSFVIFATFIHYLKPHFFTQAASLKMSCGNNRGNILTEKVTDVISSTHYLISSFKVILHYLVMFLWPTIICVDYDWKLSSGFFAPDSFFPFMILAALFSLAVYSLYKRKYSFFGFGMLWFFIAVAPRSSIIPSPELICDYKTYLPSIGWLFILATSFVAVLTFAISKIKNAPATLFKPMAQFALIMLFAMPVGYGAMSRNLVWSTSVKFWEDIAQKSPFKARGHNNLGVALSEEKRFDEAIPRYIRAIQLDRNYSDPWSNLSVAYSIKGEIDKAIVALKQAIKIFPNYPEAYNNLGTLMIKKKNYVAAEKILTIATKLRPYYGKAFFNLGRMYLDQDKKELAWESFKKATQGDLDTVEGFFTFGQMSLKLKKYDHAARAFEIALRRGTHITDSQRTSIIFNLANSHYMNKSYDKAVPLFRALCKAQPNDRRYWYNLGETLYAKNDFAQAVTVFEKLSKPPFLLVQANFRYANCLEKLGKLPDARKALALIANAQKAPEQFKEMAKREIGRLSIQEKINRGNCTLTMKDLKQAFNSTTTVG